MDRYVVGGEQKALLSQPLNAGTGARNKMQAPAVPPGLPAPLTEPTTFVRTCHTLRHDNGCEFPVDCYLRVINQTALSFALISPFAEAYIAPSHPSPLSENADSSVTTLTLRF